MRPFIDCRRRGWDTAAVLCNDRLFSGAAGWVRRSDGAHSLSSLLVSSSPGRQ